MAKQQKAELILQQLKKEYPEVYTPLNHSNVFELLIATILSPQTPDETTNKVTPELFKKYGTPEKLAAAKYESILNIIRPVNYNKTKAKNVIAAAQMLIDKFDTKVPYKMSDLISLPGVGRKVANVVISEWYARSLGTQNQNIPPLSQVIPLGREGREGGFSHNNYNKALKMYSRENRAKATPAEMLLWSKLRKRQFLGLRFLRQRAIENYIADFFEPEHKLIIEIDGVSHDENKFDYDKKREEALKNLGYRMLRFTENEVKNRLNDVLQSLENFISNNATHLNPPFPKGSLVTREENSQSVKNVESLTPNIEPTKDIKPHPCLPAGTAPLSSFGEENKYSSVARGSVLAEGFVVDTHVIRTTNRLGLTDTKDPAKIEKEMMQLFPREEWAELSLRLIFHGRNTCTAKNPICYKKKFWKDMCGCVDE